MEIEIPIVKIYIVFEKTNMLRDRTIVNITSPKFKPLAK